MLGKKKCKILKEIRQKIADENDIPFVTSECTHKGDCAGTCPRCESELRYLERELEKRQSLGKRVTVAALCAVTAIGTAGCTPQEVQTAGKPLPGDETGEIVELMGEPAEEPRPDSGAYELEGDVAYEPETAQNG